MSLQIGVDRDEKAGGQGFVLPPDAIQREEKTHKEIIFPAKEAAPVNQDDLVPITEFEDFAQVRTEAQRILTGTACIQGHNTFESSPIPSI